ncbi:hypothetical protein EOM86_14985 [Candidatus Nomurabacteria bacterium]|nr:hypothetical protein [Candidatus Nomurabacteria bacterium]
MIKEKQISNIEGTKLEVRMAKLTELLIVEASEQKELYELILTLENRLGNVLSPKEPQCGAANSKCDETDVRPAPDVSPLIKALDDIGITIVSNTIEIDRIQDRLSEIFKRLEI